MRHPAQLHCFLAAVDVRRLRALVPHGRVNAARHPPVERLERRAHRVVLLAQGGAPRDGRQRPRDPEARRIGRTTSTKSASPSACVGWRRWRTSSLTRRCSERRPPKTSSAHVSGSASKSCSSTARPAAAAAAGRSPASATAPATAPPAAAASGRSARSIRQCRRRGRHPVRRTLRAPQCLCPGRSRRCDRQSVSSAPSLSSRSSGSSSAAPRHSSCRRAPAIRTSSPRSRNTTYRTRLPGCTRCSKRRSPTPLPVAFQAVANVSLSEREVWGRCPFYITWNSGAVKWNSGGSKGSKWKFHLVPLLHGCRGRASQKRFSTTFT